MSFKVDENLPAECAGLLRGAGHVADTVTDEGLSGADDFVVAGRARAEDRVLVTLDRDFENAWVYPPAEHAGIVVLRPRSQDKPALLALTRRLLPTLATRSPAKELWIVGPDRVRFRAS